MFQPLVLSPVLEYLIVTRVLPLAPVLDTGASVPAHNFYSLYLTSMSHSRSQLQSPVLTLYSGPRFYLQWSDPWSEYPFYHTRSGPLWAFY